MRKRPLTRRLNGNERKEGDRNLADILRDMVDIQDRVDNMDKGEVEAGEEEVDVVGEGVPKSLMAGAPRLQAESLQWAGHIIRHLTKVASPNEFGCPNSQVSLL